MKVLISEDDDRLARAVAAGLRRRGMTVDVALDGGTALDGGQAEVSVHRRPVPAG